MKGEIKEIKINKANKSVTFINNGIAFSQFGIADEILDLITNLQQENYELKSKLECYENGAYYSSKVDELEQENERLKEKTKEQSLLLIDYQDMEQRYNDYKSRCEKASEYNKEIVDNYLEEDNCEYCDGRYATAKHNLNILQNGSDDNE